VSLQLRTSRIVVTGGAGFLGSHVVEALVRHGADPREVIRPRKADYNLVEREGCRKLVADARPDLVFHLAAKVGGIGANRENPGLFLYENAMMGLQLIEECRLAGVKKVVIAGTICAYPKFAPVPFKEDDIWNGYPEETNAPYGIAKKLLLVQSHAYREQYGMNSIMLFPVNLYGPRDNFDPKSSHVIPAMILKCLDAIRDKQTEIVLWGDGSPTREFIYVDDAAEGLVLAAERYDSSEPVNIGTGVEITIRDLATEIAAATGFTGTIVWDPTKPNGQPRRQLDVTRARERFGFEARVSLADGIRRTVAWAVEARAAGRL
jgi:GDP-L-fucose synthase